MPSLHAITLTNILACQGPQAVYGVLFPDDIESASDVHAVEAQESLTLRVSERDHTGSVRPFVAGLRAGRVLTVHWSDGSFEEWRIAPTTTGRGEGGFVSIQCVALWLDLVERADATGLGWVSDLVAGVRNFDYELSQRDATDILTNFVVPACPSWVALGTVDPTYVIPSLSVSRLTPAALTLLVRDTLRTVNVSCEARLRRNGTTNYLLDLVTQIGASATTPVFHPSVSLLTLQAKTDPTLQTTRVLVKGGDTPASLSGIWGSSRWRGGAPSSNDIILTDRNGAANPIAFDGQFVGTYLLRVQTGRTFPITASVAATGAVTLASVSSIQADEDFEFRVDEPLSNTRSTVTRYAISAVPDGTHITCAVSTPIVVNDQYTDWYARIWSASSGGAVITTTRISGSVASTNVIAVANSASVTSSHFVEFIQLDGAGEIPSVVDHPVYVQADPVGYGVKASEVTRPMLGIQQLVRNAWMRQWTTSGSPPDGWAIVYPNTNGAFSRNANPLYTRYGGYSLSLRDDGTHVSIPAAQVIVYPNWAEGQTQVSARCWAYFTNQIAGTPPDVDSVGYLALFARKGDGTKGKEIGRVQVAPLGAGTGDTEIDVNAWVELKIEGITLDDRGDPAAVATTPFGVLAEFYPGQGHSLGFIAYVDVIEVYPFATCPNTDYEFGDAAALLQSGNMQLDSSASPPVFYTMGVIDVERAFPDEFSRNALTLGGTVRAPDADYGIDVTIRLLQIDRDLLQAANTKLTLANRPVRSTTIQSVGRTQQSRIVAAVQSGANTTATQAPPFVALSSPTTLTHDAEISTPMAGAPAVTLPTITNGDTQGASVTYVPADPTTAPQTVVTVGSPPSRRKPRITVL